MKRYMRCDGDYVYLTDKDPVTCPHCKEVTLEEYVNVLTNDTLSQVENLIFDLGTRLKEAYT